MVLASAGSEVKVSKLREVGKLGKFISGKLPEWRAYRKNLYDYRAIGMPGTKRRCKEADENISDTVSFEFFPPGAYEVRLYNGRAREERNVTFVNVVQITGDCRVKAGCGTRGEAGVGANRACVFPFRYDGVMYTECTMQKASEKWCATETDANGHYISGRWGHCNDACAKDSESSEVEVPVTYSKVGAGVSCGTEAYRSSDSPAQCREWCTQRDDCQAYVTVEDSPCDSCLAFTENDCSLEYQKASNCTGQISAYNKMVSPGKKKAMTNEECTATFTYKNCKDGQDDRDITVGFTATYEGYPLTYRVEYGAEGGDNSLGCRGSYRDADLKFMDAQGENKVVTLVDNDVAALEVSNLRFSSNCPMKKAPSKEACSVTFFYRDCGNSAQNQDRTVTFAAYFVEEMLGYSLDYSNEGGTNTDGCGGTFRDASLNFVDANEQEQTVVLVDNSGPAAEVSNFRFSKNCPMKQVTLPTVANVKPDWSKPLGSVMTALSSPTHSNGPIQNLLDASSDTYANFGGPDWSFPTWVVFDLHSTIQVAGLEMKAANAVESPKLFAISFSDDSTAGPWQPVDTFRIHAEWNGVKRWPFAGSYAGRFWKLSFLETFDGAAPTINYVRLYPPEGALNEQPPAASLAPKYNTVRVKMGAKSVEAGLQHLIIMDILAFDASGNQLQIMELQVFADKNGADAIAPGTYTGGMAMEAVTDGSHTTLSDGGWVNGERGRDPHIGVHGITAVGSELFEIVADGDIVRLQVDFCRKNDAPALRFVRGDGAESISDQQTGMEGVSEQVHFPSPPTTLWGHRLFDSEESQWKVGDELLPPSLPSGWNYAFPSFATGLCNAKVLRVQRKVPSRVACEKNCAESTSCHYFAFSSGGGECRYFPACDLDGMNSTADFTTYKKTLSCATAIATAAESALSPPLPGSKTRHQCQAACSWQGSSFTEWRKDADVTVCRCGFPGTSYHQVLIDRGTNRKPYDSHPEVSPCNDLDSWSHGWCVLEICPSTEEATSETEFSPFGAGGHCKEGLLRKTKALPSIGGCQKLCEREADCRYFSYNEGGTDTSEYGACVRYAKCQEESLVAPGNTMFATFAKSSKGRDKPPSWRLFTTSTFRRGAKQERNCWKISKLQFFASEDCSSLEFGIAPGKQIASGLAQGFDLSHVFGQEGTAAELRSADGDFGSSEVWIGARELGGVRCIRFEQDPHKIDGWKGVLWQLNSCLHPLLGLLG
ncbi:unnamed protein product [Symbiodinium natans]|uniref:Fibronectin type-II domain-containing protein n=1 Tax=Symbiodinium natans TaxID=878477 RepID=A0A812MM09_9DINO|nr:unnamed protein product [Symbiodinium natans]